MGKIDLSKALLAEGGDASPPLDPLLTGTLLFQTDDNRVSQGRMRYALFYSYGRTLLVRFKRTIHWYGTLVKFIRSTLR